MADLSVLNSCRRAHGAGYQHGGRKGCLRGTRETTLNEIESWARDFKRSPVFWLNGLAGTGKSTIAQIISEWVFAGGVLGASFFCSHDFKDRSNLHFIFPSVISHWDCDRWGCWRSEAYLPKSPALYCAIAPRVKGQGVEGRLATGRYAILIAAGN